MKATSQITDQVARLKEGFKAAASESERLTREAKRIVDENITPQERYNSEMDRLSKLFVAGKINAEQMDRAIGNYGKKLDEATKSHVNHKDAQEGTFGAAPLKSLANYAAGLITVQKGVELVTQALREQAEEKRRAAEGVAGGLEGADALVNSGNPAQAKAIAEQLMTSGLIDRKSQQAAAFRAGGDIVRSGHADETSFLEDIGRKRIVQPTQLGELSQNISKVEHGFGPSAGSFEDIFKKLRTAASESGANTSPAELAKVFADVSDEARENDTPFDEALAVLTTEVQKTKTLRSGEGAAKEFIKNGNTFDGSQLGDYQRNLSDIQASPAKGLPDELPGLGLSGARGTQASQAASDKATQDLFAEKQSIMDAMRSDYDKYEKEHGVGGFQRFIIRSLSQTRQTIQGNEDQQMREALDGPLQRQELSPETIERMEKHLSTQTQIMQRSDRSLPPPSGLQE